MSVTICAPNVSLREITLANRAAALLGRCEGADTPALLVTTTIVYYIQAPHTIHITCTKCGKYRSWLTY